jgi:large subunit ribosomal protein L28
MARRCEITGKKVMVGNNVSHANNRTRRTFRPNLQEVSMHSFVLNRTIRMRLSTNGIRTIEHAGGIDAFLRRQSASKLDGELRKIKKQIIKASPSA